MIPDKHVFFITFIMVFIVVIAEQVNAGILLPDTAPNLQLPTTVDYSRRTIADTASNSPPLVYSGPTTTGKHEVLYSTKQKLLTFQ